MVSAAQRLQAAEEARRRLDAQGAEPDGVAPPALTSATYVRTEPIRCTVDLAPARHATLETWIKDASLFHGLPPSRRLGHTSNDVLDELVHLLVTDKRTTDLILEQLGRRPSVLAKIRKRARRQR